MVVMTEAFLFAWEAELCSLHADENSGRTDGRMESAPEVKRK